VAKSPQSAPRLHAGTSVASGHGVALVEATGMATRLGRIASLTETVSEPPSPLQREMAHVTRTITLVAVGAGLGLGALAMAATPMPPEQVFVLVLGMIVAFVPEGLLPTVTLALAFGVQRMAGRNALVKRLSAVETLGCTTVICSDKTGTLTCNQMSVRELWIAGRPGSREDGIGASAPPSDAGGDPDRELLLRSAAACNNARLAPGEGGAGWRTLGDPTEAALLELAAGGGVRREAAELRWPRIGEIAFDADRRRMTTLHRVPEGLLALVKGAPEALLPLCTQLRAQGGARALDAAWRGRAEAWIEERAREGHRVLALARRVLPADAPTDPAALEHDLELLGLAALLDPPRPDAAEAVARCRRAGISFVMITGDHPLTAARIGRDVGLWSSSPRTVEGAELERMDDRELAEVLACEVLFARTNPEQKLRVVRALQAQGHVVAVTGDGVNDAPALKQADIGVAMYASGTDVARDAADVVLADDHIASIVNAVQEGRAVYANIRKFTAYIFTSNTPEAAPFLVHALSGGAIPLALDVMQILAIDLGTDLVPALALGAEPAEDGVMDEPPRRRDEHVITAALLRRAYAWLGLLQAAAAMAAFFVAHAAAGWAGSWLDLPDAGEPHRAATSAVLATVVATQLGNLLAQRTQTVSILRVGLRGNPLVLVGIAVAVALLLTILYLPPLQRVFGTAPISPTSWFFAALSAPLLLVADELRKLWLRRRGSGGIASARGPSRR
jgi:Ca2+-transporting ATPase